MSAKLMKNKIFFFAIFLGLASCAHDGKAQQKSLYQLVSFQVSSGDAIFEVFRSTDLTNWMAFSPNYDCGGSSWGSNGVRDPSITFFNGSYYLAHTNSCGNPNTYVIGYSHSSDGINWANHSTLDLTQLGIPNANFAWAPEWFIDPNASGLSSVHLFLTVSTNGGGFLPYELHPTAADFSTWSNAQLINGITTFIDVFPVYKSGTYYLWYKAQDGSCNIEYASSSTLLGTYTVVKSGNWAGFTNQGCVEGPALIQKSDGSWRIFLDLDFNDLADGQLNYADDNGSNWATWTTITSISTPTQAKQGTVINLGPAPSSAMRGQSTIGGQAVIR